MSAVLLLLPLLAANQVARAADNLWVGPNFGDWNAPANWSVGLVPDVLFDEAAAINNHTIAVLSTPAMSLGTPLNVGGVKLGQAVGDVGGLRITNNGDLRSVAGVSETGALAIGVAGQGNLVILGGGTLTGTSLTLSGSAFSSVELGDTSGLVASLLIGGMASLQQETTIIGPNVDFSAGGDLTLGDTSLLIAEIRHASLHSPLKSAGTAMLGGTFSPTFNGVMPMLGDTWNIIDANSITGGFAALDTSAAPVLPAGQFYQLIQTNGGVNGRLVQLAIVVPAPSSLAILAFAALAGTVIRRRRRARAAAK